MHTTTFIQYHPTTHYGYANPYNNIYGDNGVVALNIALLCQSHSQMPCCPRAATSAGDADAAVRWDSCRLDFFGTFLIKQKSTETIINMNGRLYDPVIGRFFSPDNFVQMPHFTQAYNRYSYALNNPLKYVDPSGEFGMLFGLMHAMQELARIFSSSMFANLDGWNFNVLTGEKTWVSTMGRAEGIDYINLTDGTNSFDQIAVPANNYTITCSTNPLGYTNVNVTGTAPLGDGMSYNVNYSNSFYTEHAPILLPEAIVTGALPNNSFNTRGEQGITYSSFNVGDLIGIGLLAKGIISWGAKTLGASVAKTEMQTVYRVFGGEARAQGFSWTPINPQTVNNFRNVAGLPSGNSANLMLEGVAKTKKIIKIRSALPLDGNIGGLTKYIINPNNVNITNLLILKP